MEHIYCGSAKERTFENGSVINVSLTLNGMAELFEKYGFTTESGKKIIKLKIGRRREVGKYGETHTVEIDTWKPGQEQAPSAKDDDGVPW